MRIISERKHVNVREYSLFFAFSDDTNSGFSFPCDRAGNIDKDSMTPEGLDNLTKCLDGTYDVVSKGVVKDSWSYVEPSIGICSDCGCEVQLSGFTNTCDCGADYSIVGTRLAPRSHWGEETGEAFW